MKKVIIKVLREMDKDKAICTKLKTSMPSSLQDVIDVEGRQLTRSDYRSMEADE